MRASKINLGCFINGYHMLEVGNPFAHAIRQGILPHRSAAERSIENIRFMGDAFVTNVEELRKTLGSVPTG